MNIGTHIAMFPMFAQVIASLVTGTRPDSYPLGYGAQTLLILSLFPITMAYVVVVHRALDLRLVIRQGLQYALTKNAILAAQILVTTGVIFAAAAIVGDPQAQTLQRITIIALGVLFVFLIRRIAEKLRNLC